MGRELDCSVLEEIEDHLSERERSALESSRTAPHAELEEVDDGIGRFVPVGEELDEEVLRFEMDDPRVPADVEAGDYVWVTVTGDEITDLVRAPALTAALSTYFRRRHERIEDETPSGDTPGENVDPFSDENLFD